MRAPLIHNVVLALVVVVAWFQWGEGRNTEENRALVEIIDSINHPNGSAFSSWDRKDCCDLNVTTCNDNSNVMIIKLSGAREPRLGTWYPNVTLFMQFPELKELYLDHNQIGGELEGFCELKNLYRLDLGYNALEGSIHPCLGTMKNLDYLDLSNNRLQGVIPSSIFNNLTGLSVFDISDNRLDGAISFSMFANLSNLLYLDLSNNYRLEVETESPSWVPSFSLQVLNLANCNLNNRSGHVIPSFISTQHMEWLDLSHNSLVGNIPSWLLFNLTSALFLRNNKFNGLFPRSDQGMVSSLAAFDVSDNQIYGPLPENIGKFLPYLQHVNLSGNALQGNIPPSLGEVWYDLFQLPYGRFPPSYGELFLEILDLSNNNLSGEIPRSLTQNGTSLVYLNLSNNSLEGEILPRDSNMVKLECLQLHGNRFQGIISPGLSNSSSLVILDIRNNQLSGNIPNWLFDLPHLVAVLMGGNQLQGHLRKRLCQMQTLQVLDISNNHILGSIPSCLNNIPFWTTRSPNPDGTNYFTEKGRLYYLLHATQPEVDLFMQAPEIELRIGTDFITKGNLYSFEGLPLSLMTGIDMSLNQLTGNIPPQMGELSQLHSLNLSNNLLMGSIPSSFQNLKTIESLDLSNNKLNGAIPLEMIQLNSLSTFNVSYNNLSGRIPFEQQFSTFSKSSYEGNPNLCGKPVERNCTPNIPSETPDEKNEEEESRITDDPVFFYAFLVISYGFGFWGFMGVLFFKKMWRQNFFKTVEEYTHSFLDKFSGF